MKAKSHSTVKPADGTLLKRDNELETQMKQFWSEDVERYRRESEERYNERFVKRVAEYFGATPPNSAITDPARGTEWAFSLLSDQYGASPHGETEDVTQLTASRAKAQAVSGQQSYVSKSVKVALQIVDSATKVGLRKTYIVWGEDCPIEDSKEVGQALRDRGFSVVYESRPTCIPVSDPWRLRVEW